MVANSVTKQMTSYRAVVAVGHKKTVTNRKREWLIVRPLYAPRVFML